MGVRTHNDLAAATVPLLAGWSWPRSWRAVVLVLTVSSPPPPIPLFWYVVHVVIGMFLHVSNEDCVSCCFVCDMVRLRGGLG